MLLTQADVLHTYETQVFKYVKPESKHRYTPDFPITGTNVIIETKGKWEASDRKKMKLIIEAYPETMFIMLFGRASNTITKKSTTTYGDWCDANGLRWMDMRDFKQEPKQCLEQAVSKTVLPRVSATVTRRKKKLQVNT